MSSMRGSGTRSDDLLPLAREASRRNRARVAPLLRSALSRLSTLQVELASSRQQLLDVRRQVELLCVENDGLKRCVAQYKSEAAKRLENTSIGTRIANELTQGLGEEFSGWVRRLRARRVYVRRGEVLFGPGATCAGLYVVNSGSLKTVLGSKDGQTQISAFHLAGDLIGLDGMFARVHDCQVVALEDSDVNHMPLDQLDALACACDQFRHNLYRALAREFVRAHALMLSLGTGRADQRVAGYLLEVSRRLHAIGYSSSALNLRMTRAEIGSYLGLKLETVSRLLSRLHREGTIGISGRTVHLFNRETLQQIADGES